MSLSTIQTRAEVQKLIKRYHELQQEVKTADIEEATRKAAQAEKLMSQINTLQSALQNHNKTTKPKEDSHTPGPIKKETTRTPSSPDDKRKELEKRINRIEDAQKRTRVQIEQLNKAKAELSNLQTKAEAARIAFTEHRPKTLELEKLKKLVQIKDEQHLTLKKEFEMVRHQAQKDAELLRNERDTALERLKQLEKENMRLLRQRGNNGYQKGVLIGGGVGILCLIVLIVLTFQTALFDSIVCELKNYPTECSFLPPLVTNHQDRTQ